MTGHIFTRLLGALLLATALVLPAAADNTSPVGKWRTFDPDTGVPKTVVEITEANGELTGTVIELLDDGETTCTQCEGDKKDQPSSAWRSSGISTGDGDEWSGGTILRSRQWARRRTQSIELARRRQQTRSHWLERFHEPLPDLGTGRIAPGQHARTERWRAVFLCRPSWPPLPAPRPLTPGGGGQLSAPHIAACFNKSFA